MWYSMSRFLLFYRYLLGVMTTLGNMKRQPAGHGLFFCFMLHDTISKCHMMCKKVAFTSIKNVDHTLFIVLLAVSV